MTSLRKNALHLLGTALLAILAIFLVLHGRSSWAAAQRLSQDPVPQAIARSTDYLVRHTGEDGRFDYRLNMDPNVEVSNSYNLLRHAGAIYALGMAYERQPDEQVKAAMERAGRYLHEVAIDPVPEEKGLLAVWSRPEITGRDGPPEAKLGGTGLGLVALLYLEKVHPGFTPMEQLRQMGRFILFMQKENGSFYSRYIPAKGGRRNKPRSRYYPGEAALGLLLLYQADPDPVWLEAATRALLYLAEQDAGRKHVAADHWALLATEQLFALPEEAVSPSDRELLMDHAVQIVERILRDQIEGPVRPMYMGSFSSTGKVTPTATRLEGLLAALNFLPPEATDLRERIQSSVAKGIHFLLWAQVEVGEYSGAFPRAIARLPETDPDAEKFNPRAREVRIDYVQHALSAMIRYAQMAR